MARFEEAIHVLETAAQLASRPPYVLGTLGYAYARAGRLREAQEILKELEKQSSRTYVIPSTLARAPGGQMQGAPTQAMRPHRRGAATPQMPARRRAPLGCGPQRPLVLSLAPGQQTEKRVYAWLQQGNGIIRHPL